MIEAIPTDRELEALKILWRDGEATVHDVWQAMTADDNKLAYTTVLSLLQVMEQKELVGHTRTGKAYSYFAKIRRAPTFRKLAHNFLDKVFDGAVDEYLVRVLESKRLSHDVLTRLERLIAEAKSKSSDTDKSKKETRR